jgi:hypothetical protein
MMDSSKRQDGIGGSRLFLPTENDLSFFHALALLHDLSSMSNTASEAVSSRM